MSESKEESTLPKICFKCKEMFGNAIYDFMCSICFKQSRHENKKKQHSRQPDAYDQKTTKNHSDKNREQRKSKVQSTQFQDQQGRSKECKQKQKSGKKEEPAKCSICKKKVGMLGYSCGHCSQLFCKFHRLPEDHECRVDFVSLGKKKLKLQNPSIQSSKVEKI